MKVIIAEKPSMGRTIAEAVGSERKRGGYIEGQEYLVTWCYGHLYALQDVENYIFPDIKRNEKVTWKDSMEYLPFFPDGWEFKYKRVDGVAEQVRTISNLINREDVDTIYCAGDADREGEVIVRLVLENNLRKQKKILRVWAQSLTAEAIREAIRNAKPDSEYDGISEAGKARAAVDWMMGIELTRYATVKSNCGELIRIGRCVTPIVEKVVEREREIKNFVPENYLAIAGKVERDDGSITLTCKKEFKSDETQEANDYAKLLNGKGTIVSEAEKKDVEIQPGKLFSLSDLQNFVCKIDKSLSPSDVLDTVQSLYEQGYVTYPRTNSSYLTTDEISRIDAIISRLRWNGFEKIENKPGNKRIYDNSKVESHSAITPTENIPNNLSGKEKEIYEIIRNRFLAVFCSEPCIVERTKYTLTCGQEVFNPKGDVQKQAGWRIFEKPFSEDKSLPLLKKGEIVHPDYKPVGKTTTAPSRYTVSSLNNWMLSPLKKGESDGIQREYTDAEWKDILSDATICTEATRAGIIDNAIKSKYIELKKGTYYATEMGEYVVDIAKSLCIDLSPRKTVELSRSMHEISVGNKSKIDLYEETKSMIEEIFRKNADVKNMTVPTNDKESVGKCPKCGKNVYENKVAFSCEDKACGFAIWKKNNKYFDAIGFKPTKAKVKSILKDGRVLAKGLVSKKGNKYDAYLVLGGINGKYPEWKLEFPNKK